MNINPNFKAQFLKNLPYKPYCTNDLGCTFINSKEYAVTKRYVQCNPPHQIVYLVFDIDDPQAVMSWYDANLPPPSWTAQNPENGHAHIVYELKTPVLTTDASRQKIVRYLSAIQTGLAQKLGADMGYAQLLMKNPCHNHWRVKIWTEEKYELDYLADFVDLAIKPKKQQEVFGLGRNCTLFETTRKWAYKAIRTHRGSTFSEWLREVIVRCEQVNSDFKSPLPYSEIKATAKSIARYCWKHDAYCYQEFIQRQAYKGMLGDSSPGGKARSDQYNVLREETQILRKQGLSYTEIAKTLSISRRSAINWCKLGGASATKIR